MTAGVALVTGGSRGLGRAAARALAADGWSVAVTGRHPGALADVAQDATLTLTADATDPDATRAAVERTEAELGPLDLLVVSAGAFAAGGRVWETDPETWWSDVEVNLRGVQLALHSALPGMVARGEGRVVVLGSGMGMVPTPGASAYSASKAAVARLVETAAAELEGTGVTVLTVSPGMVRTDMTSGFPEGFLELRPELREPDPSAWTPVEAFLQLLGRITTGDLDALSGRFLHVRDDPSTAVRAARDVPARGVLRVLPWGDG